MIIALTYTGSMGKHPNYIDWISQNDNIDVIKLSAEENNLDAIDICDALILSGGLDIHPRFYANKKIDYKFRPEKFNEQRDQFEMDAFKISQEKSMPVLAICRGLQLVNCFFGGTLKQDLGTLNMIHKAEKTSSVQKDRAHGVSIEGGTLLNEISKNGTRAVVNSAHHQAIKKPGKGLRVNCWSDDGTIEGVEWVDKNHKSFLLCVQWHPERMFQFQLQDSVLSKNIRDRFILEIEKSKEIQL
jgi:putative glutamine amidotransferase